MDGASPVVVVVDDDPDFRALASRWLELDDFTVVGFESGEACLQGLGRPLPDALCLDLQMPGMGGMATLRRIHGRYPDLPVLILTGNSGVDTVVEAMQDGAYDYIAKPLDRTRLVTAVRNAVERHRMALRMSELERDAGDGGYEGIVGRSASMRALYRQLDRVARADISVLIMGESGTGKELVASAIHRRGPRGRNEFVAINCAAIPEHLQESELFGHEKGAFTGASSRRAGRFEQADGGTLFLDEVGELSPSLQAKLLRVLQVKRFHRVGGTTEVKSDFRILAASHKDLQAEVVAGRFREDLFFRLAVFDLHVPPLRSRQGDVPLLVAHFCDLLGERMGTRPPRVDVSVVQLLNTYEWPGNVRELENALYRAAVVAEGKVQVADLPQRVREALAKRGSRAELTTTGRANTQELRAAVAVNVSRDRPVPEFPERVAPSFPSGGFAPFEREAAPADSVKLLPEGPNAVLPSLAELERRAITLAHTRTGGDIPQMVKILGIGRTTLYRKLKTYDLR